MRGTYDDGGGGVGFGTTLGQDQRLATHRKFRETSVAKEQNKHVK